MHGPALGQRRSTLCDCAVGGVAIGTYRRHGMFVTDDGFVYAYRYELAESETQPKNRCDVRQLEPGSPERYACLHERSFLQARLVPALLSSLLLDTVSVTESARVEWRYDDADGGEARLEVPGRGENGGALEIGWCKTDGASQMSSRAASRIIDVFRRVRRVLRSEGRFVGYCPDYWEPRKEIAPGVRAWWSLEG